MQLTPQQAEEIYNKLDNDLILSCINTYYKDWEERQSLFDFYKDMIVELFDYLGDALDNPNDDWYTDLAYERADGKIDIYYHAIYKSLYVFSEYVNEAIEEMGYPKDWGIEKAIQIWQGRYYEQFAQACIDAWIELQEDNK